MNKKKQEADIHNEAHNEASQHAENQAANQAQAGVNEKEQNNEQAELSPEDKLAAAQDEIAQLKDKYLRQVAEFDNYRKRTLKEKTELILNGGEKVLSALLPVLDDLERAAENIEKSNDVDTLREGVKLIIDKLQKTLSAQGLQRIETKGQPFDTDFHEAIALVPAADETQKNHVIDCVQPGYMLNNKVIRHAKVVVGQ